MDRKDDSQLCPKCKTPNDTNAEYCWRCYFDFKPDPIPRFARAADEPSRARLNSDGEVKINIGWISIFFRILVSSGIVYASWRIVQWLGRDAGWSPHLMLLYFWGGWIVILMLAYASEDELPPPETDWTEYFSFNPFNFDDDRNRFILSWHITLFLPKIVLRTLRLLWIKIFS